MIYAYRCLKPGSNRDSPTDPHKKQPAEWDIRFKKSFLSFLTTPSQLPVQAWSVLPFLLLVWETPLLVPLPPCLASDGKPAAHRKCCTSWCSRFEVPEVTQDHEQGLHLWHPFTLSTHKFLALATINIFSAFQEFTFDPQSEPALSSTDP